MVNMGRDTTKAVWTQNIIIIIIFFFTFQLPCTSTFSCAL